MNVGLVGSRPPIALANAPWRDYCRQVTIARALLLSLLLTLAPTAAAQAQDPIMPLSDVRPGMDCRGLSVVRGTDISSFDVEVIDVVDARPDGARILTESSGPAIEPAGIGAGFSGSPVLCRGSDGVERNAGAISEGLGDFGNRLALVTPIEEVLGEPPGVPASARPLPAGTRRRPLAAPLTVTGLSSDTRRVLERAVQRSGRLLIDAPAAASSRFPPQDLRPGASVAAGYSTGDIQLSAVGTVTYRAGDRVWGFGHPLDGAGVRSLFLQDAYVYTVVNNPVNGFGGTSYKLAAPGHELGTVTSDALDAVIGQIGGLPELTQLRITARDTASGRFAAIDSALADESAVDEPLGNSGLRLIGSLAVTDAVTRALRGTPARQSGDMCLLVKLRERVEPLRFCNRYVGNGDLLNGGFGSFAAAISQDFDIAAALIDEVTFARLHVESARAIIHVRRGLAQGLILGVDAPRRARRGQLIRVRVRYRLVRGPIQTTSFEWRIPRGSRLGRRQLRVAGPGLDDAEGFGVFIFDFDDFGAPPDTGPRNVEQLAAEFAAIRRYDGLRARLAPRSGEEEDPDTGEELPSEFLDLSEGRRAYRHPDLRLSGAAGTAIRILRRR